jgi:hypothetical protein
MMSEDAICKRTVNWLWALHLVEESDGRKHGGEQSSDNGRLKSLNLK